MTVLLLLRRPESPNQDNNCYSQGLWTQRSQSLWTNPWSSSQASHPWSLHTETQSNPVYIKIISCQYLTSCQILGLFPWQITFINLQAQAWFIVQDISLLHLKTRHHPTLSNTSRSLSSGTWKSRLETNTVTLSLDGSCCTTCPWSSGSAHNKHSAKDTQHTLTAHNKHSATDTQHTMTAHTQCYRHTPWQHTMNTVLQTHTLTAHNEHSATDTHPDSTQWTQCYRHTPWLHTMNTVLQTHPDSTQWTQCYSTQWTQCYRHTPWQHTQWTQCYRHTPWLHTMNTVLQTHPDSTQWTQCYRHTLTAHNEHSATDTHPDSRCRTLHTMDATHYTHTSWLCT